MMKTYVEEDWDDEDMNEEENPYIIPIDETDEDTEYGENPAWDW